MSKTKSIFIMIFVLIGFFVTPSKADIIRLKTGVKIECIIEEERDEVVVVNIDALKATYARTQIDSITKASAEENADLKEKWEISRRRPLTQETEEEIKEPVSVGEKIETFEIFKEALKAGKLPPLHSTVTLESASRIMNGIGINEQQLRDKLPYIDNNPYKVEHVNENEAIIYFEEDRGGKAHPYILTKEGDWLRIDFAKMQERIIIDENDWRWKEDNK